MSDTKLEQFAQALSEYLDKSTKLKEEKLVIEYLKQKSVLRKLEKQIRKYRKRIIG